VDDERSAAEVYKNVANVRHLENYFVHLVAIHAAPHLMWPELVQRMVEN
jgi:hypothetical protein